MNNGDKVVLPFQVETSRVLELLAKEIYDSPNALLRENVQNGYDAILERCQETGESPDTLTIRLNLVGDKLTIQDEGIGMSQSVLATSFWRPGFSGKHTERAKKAGVVGTFGIGAMANFGVSSELIVETESWEENKRWRSAVRKEDLKIGEDCIPLEEIPQQGNYGTTVTARLLPSFQINEQAIKQYLTPYVANLPIRVYVGDEVISQQVSLLPASVIALLDSQQLSNGHITLDLTAYLTANKQVCVTATSIEVQNQQLVGSVDLQQGQQRVMAQCNAFGLSTIPINSHYSWGGTVNLSMLRPTAGREALSRESIQLINGVIALIDKGVSEKLAELSECDNNGSFLNYVSNHNRSDLADLVTVQMLPGNERYELGSIASQVANKSAQWYGGRNQQTLQAFSGIDTPLVYLDNSGSRRSIQQRYINEKLSIQQASDTVKEKKKFLESELTIPEIALVVKLTTTLIDDYGFVGPEVYFAEFSHQVPFMVTSEGSKLALALRRDSSEVAPVIGCYSKAREVFDGVVKDFVRVHLYNRIQSFVPSSSRLGAEALINLLQKNRDVFSYGSQDSYSLDEFLKQIGLGQGTIAEASSRRVRTAQPQHVSHSQVASAAIIHRPESTAGITEEMPQEGDPAPPIRRPNVETLNTKIIEATSDIAELNGYHMLLSLSRRVFQREREFFFQPHSTKVIWGGHRIVFIFTIASGTLSFYYDVELKKPLDLKDPGGEALITSTVITKDRIFVPIPDLMVPALTVEEGQTKDFSVRYDTLVTK